jgi:hypothetical protein
MKFVINIIYSSYQIRKFTIKQKKKKKIIKDDDLRLNRPIIINSNFDYFTKSGGIFFFFFFFKKKKENLQLIGYHPIFIFNWPRLFPNSVVGVVVELLLPFAGGDFEPWSVLSPFICGLLE